MHSLEEVIKMKILNIMLVLIFLPSSLFSESEVGIATNIMNGTANTDKNIVEVHPSGHLVNIGPKKEKSKEKIWYKKNWDREKLYNRLYGTKSTTGKFLLQDGDGSGMFVKNQILIKNQQNINAYYANKSAEERVNERMLSSLKGDCIFPFRVDVAVNPIQIKVTCKIQEDNSFIDLIMHLVPSNQSYSLVAIPKYYVSTKGETVPIDKERSYITNFADTTSNIATYVNTQQVKKNISYLAQGVGLGMSRSANRYLNEREAANRQQEVIVSGGINPIVTQTTNAKEPSVKEYTIAGFVGGVFDGIGRIASNMEGDFPYLYRIEKGSVINFFITPLIVSSKNNQRNQTQNGRMK